MPGIPEAFSDLVGAPHFAHLVTLNPDGGPQSSPVWVARDGDDVLFSTDATYRKARNMRRDARVALSIQDEANPYRYVELRGRAELSPRPDWAFVDELSQAYLGREYPAKRAEAEGLIVRVRVSQAVTLDHSPRPADQPHPADLSDLMSPPHFGHIATINPDGSPQTSPVWTVREGDDVLFWTSAGTRKARNLARNPAVAVSAHDVTNGYRYEELRGRAELTPVGNDYALLDALARRYWQVEEYPEKSESAEGVVVRISPRHRVSFGGS
jgi:PPOX class probable F420-dependent enzyme